MIKQVILNRKQYLRTRNLMKEYKVHFDYLKVEIYNEKTTIRVEKYIKEKSIWICLQEKLNIKYQGNLRFEDYFESKLIKLARQVNNYISGVAKLC